MRPNRKRNKSFGRTERVASTIRQVIADELVEMAGEDFAYVSVTEVEVDPELTRARVYLSTLDQSEEDIEGVRANTARIRKAVARKANLRRTPELTFLVDPGITQGAKIEQILADMKDDRAFRES